MSKRGQGKKWSAAELARLMQVYHDLRRTQEVTRFFWKEVAVRMRDRTPNQCSSRVHYLIHGPRHRSEMPKGLRPVDHVAERARNVPRAVLADALARAQLDHPTITAAFFGDPLPGRSALDRMGGEYRPRISLAPVHLSRD